MHKRIEDTRGFIRYAIDAWNLDLDYSFSIRLKQNNKFIGSFGVIHENGRIQFGYVLTPTEWGRGYATEAVKKMMEVLHSLDWVKGICKLMLHTLDAHTLYTKFGYAPPVYPDRYLEKMQKQHWQ